VSERTAIRDVQPEVILGCCARAASTRVGQLRSLYALQDLVVIAIARDVRSLYAIQNWVVIAMACDVRTLTKQESRLTGLIRSCTVSVELAPTLCVGCISNSAEIALASTCLWLHYAQCLHVRLAGLVVPPVGSASPHNEY
jgi:hypothetical protein